MPHQAFPKPYSNTSVLYRLVFWLSQNPLNLFIVLLGLQFLSSIQAQTTLSSIAPRGRRLMSRDSEASASLDLFYDKDLASDHDFALSSASTALGTRAHPPGRMLQTGPQGTEFQVNTYTTSDQNYPSIAALINDSFVVTWNSDGHDGYYTGIYGQMYDANGSKKGTEFQANTYTTNDQWRPSTAALTNGGFVVTWDSDGQDGSGYGVYGQIYNADGSKKASEFRVNTYTNNYQFDSSTAALTNGDFVVTWSSNAQDGSGYGVYGQIYNADGSKKATEFQANTYTTNDQWQSSIAALTSGGFVVTWSSYGQDGSGYSYGVYGQMYDIDGLKKSTEFQVNTNTTSHQCQSSTAALTSGGFVVTWQSYEQDGSNYGVYGQIYHANGSKKATEFQVNTYTTNSQNEPSTAALMNGGFVVTWTSYGQGQDGSLNRVYGQIYNADGSKKATEFQVNTYTSYYYNGQSNPSTASLPHGGFVVTWASDGQDGSNYGVFGQRFDDNGNKINIASTPNPSATISASAFYTPSQTASASNTALYSSSLSAFASPSQTQIASFSPAASASRMTNPSASTAPARSNRAPVMQLILNQIAKVALPFEFTIDKTIAFDPEGDAIGYNLIQKTSLSLPVWLNFNTSSLRLWGTPYNSDLGAYTLALRANDSLSVASSEFSLRVLPSLNLINIPTAIRYKPGAAVALFANSTVSSEVSQTLRMSIVLSDIAAGSFANSLLPDGTSAYDPSIGVWSMSGPSISVSTTLKALSFIISADYDQDFSLSTELSDGINLPINSTIQFNLSKTPDSSKVIAASVSTIGAALIMLCALYLYYTKKLAKARAADSPLAYQVQNRLKLGYWTYTSTEGREFAQGIKGIENILRSKDIELKFEPKDKLAKTADIIAREIRNKRPGLKSALCFNNALVHKDLSIYAYKMAHVILNQLFKHHARHMPQEANPMRKAPSSISITNPSSVKPLS